jgi:RNA polymerase sigma-70 factor (ECF subfamily)
MTEQEIQELIAESQRGNHQAFGQIYDLYSQQLLNFLIGKLAHRQTAEDLLQTVFVKAWTNINRYEPRSTAKFSTWLFQIANFTLIDHWRTRKTTSEISGVENLAQFAQNPKFYEEYGYLWKAIATLPITYQIVLDLRFKQDLSVEETSKIMNKSQVSVRVLQHRALKALKKQLTNVL